MIWHDQSAESGILQNAHTEVSEITDSAECTLVCYDQSVELMILQNERVDSAD